MDKENERIHDEIIAFLDGLDQNNDTYSSEETTKNIDKKIQLISLPANNYISNLHNQLNNFIAQGQNGVYISFQRPANNIMALLNQSNIETTNLSIIDIATELSTHLDDKGPQFYESYISDIFKKIQYETNTLATKTPLTNKKFILIDSINTMALYLTQQQIIELLTLIQNNILSDNTTKLYVYGANELISNKITTSIQEYLNIIDTPIKTKDQQIISHKW
jgi:hypothetical protein